MKASEVKICFGSQNSGLGDGNSHIGMPTMQKGEIEKALKEAFLKTDEKLMTDEGQKQCHEIRREVSRR